MFKKLSVVFCGLGVVLLTASAASAQTATQEAKANTKSAAHQTGAVMSDAEITTAVKTKLLADKTVGGLKIDVDTKDGVVTLAGPVNSAAERSAALRITRATSGVKSVVNKLTLEPSTTTTDTTKNEIKDKSKDAAHATENGAKKVEHATENGAKKAGHATEDAAKKTGAATENAAKKTGNAADDAAHKTASVLTDAEITTSVKTKLLADKTVGGLKIDVDTADHVVTLTGPVSSAAERTEAVRLARTTKGVKSVVDKLTIEPKK
jgi:hyperosmotically inducible protein